MNLNPQVEQNIIRVPIPKVSKEVKETLKKSSHQLLEKTKIGIRLVRQDLRNDIKKKIGKNTDVLRRMEKQAQDITDKFTKEADLLYENKVKEINNY